MPLHPVERRSVSDAVFEQLLGSVLDGELSPGQSLPPERTLTDALGVNRQAVREALQRLAQAGVIDIRHGGGSRVLDYRAAAGLDLLPRLLATADGTVNADAVRSLMELRLCLGPDVARRCAQRAGRSTADAVQSTVEAMADASGDLDQLAALDLAFWDGLVEGCENIAYRLAFNGLRRTYEPIADLVGPVLAEELADVGARREIAAAVRAREGEVAATAAARLLGRGERAVRSMLEEQA